MNDNLETAFPIEFTDRSDSGFDGQQTVELGMTLRDYFAGKALTAIMNAPPSDRFRNENGKPYETWTEIALAAYEMANAMLVQREQVLDQLLEKK